MASPIVVRRSTGLEVDGRTVPRKKPSNYKSLKFASLPVQCDICPYRGKEVGGNGICTKYELGAMCVIRKDIKKIVDKFEKNRDYAQVVPLLEQEFMDNYAKLKFFETVESMTGELNPEVTKRIRVLDGLGKTLNELKTTRTTTEVTQTRTLTDDQKEQIAQTLRMTTEEASNAVESA